MNLSTPSRRAMTATCEIPIVRARCCGCDMRAKMTPMTTASVTIAIRTCETRTM
jgi:hypothetical protein